MSAIAITAVTPSTEPGSGPAGTVTGPDAALASQYFFDRYGIDLDHLLLPIEHELGQAGENLRGQACFRQIEDARKSDDGNLPLGPWERELKAADWELVGKRSVECLAERSKDLQLAAWALESGLHCHGLVALAPGLALMRCLSESFWENIHPGDAAEDRDYRINIFRWIDAKFPNLVALLPLTEAGPEDGGLNLGNWRRANLPDEEGRHDPAKQETFLAVLAATPTAILATQNRQVQAGRDAIEALDLSLDRICGEESPGFSGLKSVLNEIEGLVSAELVQRGYNEVEPDDAVNAEPEQPVGNLETPFAPSSGQNLAHRQEAYRMLARAADSLMQTDPHSPVPYLIRQAIAWGHMDTRALYQELFLDRGGMINVFHLLGLETDVSSDRECAEPNQE